MEKRERVRCVGVVFSFGRFRGENNERNGESKREIKRGKGGNRVKEV